MELHKLDLLHLAYDREQRYTALQMEIDMEKFKPVMCFIVIPADTLFFTMTFLS